MKEYKEKIENFYKTIEKLENEGYTFGHNGQTRPILKNDTVVGMIKNYFEIVMFK